MDLKKHAAEIEKKQNPCTGFEREREEKDPIEKYIEGSPAEPSSPEQRAKA